MGTLVGVTMSSIDVTDDITLRVGTSRMSSVDVTDAELNLKVGTSMFNRASDPTARRGPAAAQDTP